jgi:hypothetical protein
MLKQGKKSVPLYLSFSTDKGGRGITVEHCHEYHRVKEVDSPLSNLHTSIALQNSSKERLFRQRYMQMGAQCSYQSCEIDAPKKHCSSFEPSFVPFNFLAQSKF